MNPRRIRLLISLSVCHNREVTLLCIYQSTCVNIPPQSEMILGFLHRAQLGKQDLLMRRILKINLEKRDIKNIER